MSEHAAARIAEVRAASETRARELLARATNGSITYTEAWYSLPGPAADLTYPFLCRAEIQQLMGGKAKETDPGFAVVNADRIKAEGEAWLQLWAKHESAVFAEHAEMVEWMMKPIYTDAAIEAEARERLSNSTFEREVRRRMKQIQAEEDN